jgi:hypothetical protein
MDIPKSKYFRNILLSRNYSALVRLPLVGCAIFRLVFMDPLRELGRTLLVLGAALFFVGALLFFGGKLPLRLGHLPGDIIHRGERTTFYFPIVTCIVLSAGISFLLWLFSHFRR